MIKRIAIRIMVVVFMAIIEEICLFGVLIIILRFTTSITGFYSMKKRVVKWKNYDGYEGSKEKEKFISKRWFDYYI